MRGNTAVKRYEFNRYITELTLQTDLLNKTLYLHCSLVYCSIIKGKQRHLALFS